MVNNENKDVAKLVIYYKTEFGELYHGNNQDILKQFQNNYFTSILTDPPYGISFMNKKWDYQVPSIESWQECLRVLKPGGTLLCFAGTRTQHRMAVNIEDAGFILKDCLMWFFGTGFPKALDISKAIDKAMGVEREIVGHMGGRYNSPGTDIRSGKYVGGEAGGLADWGHITEPGSELAKLFDGYKSHGLKPAYEPIILAMKPNDGSYVENALKHGVAGLNIDACRIGFTSESDEKESKNKNRHADFDSGPRENKIFGVDNRERGEAGNYDPPGRYPANILFTHHPECEMVGAKKIKAITGGGVKVTGDLYGEFKGYKYPKTITKGGEDGTETIKVWVCHPDCPIRTLDEQSGSRPGCKSPSTAKPGSKFRPDQGNYMPQGPIYPDTGTASRFFKQCNYSKEEVARFKYCSKASRTERNLGLTEHGLKNTHPTVKPIAILEYLLNLILPPKDGIILDPYFGSGSLGVICERMKIKYVGIEMEKGNCEIAKYRMNYKEAQNKPETKQLSLF